MKKLIIITTILTLTAVLAGCQKPQNTNPVRGGYEIADQSENAVYLNGETIYLPIYSSIFHFKDFRTVDLTATMSIHNVDLSNPINIIRADYFDTNGNLVKTYIDKTLMLKPLQTMQIVIQENDKDGGTGANFIVEWASTAKVISPIVEGVMISASGQQGISFTTSGKVIKSFIDK